MEATCPRCGTALPEPDANFCAACGLPQLRVSDEALVETSTEAGATAQPHADTATSSKIDTRFLLRCCLIVTGVIFTLLVLSSVLPFTAVLVLGLAPMAAVAAVILYRRGRMTMPMSAGTGARVGTVTGLLLSLIFTFMVALSLFVLRYKLHSNAIDQAMQQQAAHTQEMWQQMTGQKMDAAQLAMIQSPQMRASSTLISVGFFSLLTIGWMSVTGALSGWMLASSRRSR